MAGIILIGVLNVLMFIWFGYQFSQDKANVWKKRPRGDAAPAPAPPADEAKD
ncbi:MAG: hypothetical protein MUE77_04350 [Sandarakinorhabdus sp.]|nr:hypothetical protein [Sandarakinorhabdus sp.]